MTPPLLQRLVPAAGCWLTALAAAAHPGHELTRHGVVHAAASPYHLATLGLAGAVLWLAARWITRPSCRRWLHGLGATVVCVAAGLWLLGM
jgi:hypothetical protein